MTSLELERWRGHNVPVLSRDEISRYNVQDYLNWIQYSNGYMGAPTPVTTYGNRPAEPISSSFEGFVWGMLYADGPVAAVEAYRLRVFGQAPLLYQDFVDGRPGDFFDDPALDQLREPWPGGNLSDLMKRSLIYGDFAGNSFGVDLDDEIVLLRPDWVEIILEKRDYRGGQVGWRQRGIMYYEGGLGVGDGVAFLPGEYFHFVPGLPDPLATFRGMSWLTPLVREVQADKAASDHKVAFFENSASPNLAVSLPKEITPKQFEEFVEKMDAKHKGVQNTGRTLYTAGGADVTVIGANMQQMDFSSVQGRGETRVANAGGVPPVLLSFAEGMQGSSLNAGNYTAAKRNFTDTTMRDLWSNKAGSLQKMDRFRPPRPKSRLWYVGRDIPFMHEDAQDLAQIQQTQASTVNSYITAGFKPDTAVAAVERDDLKLLEHTGLTSVQLMPPGSQDADGDGVPDAEAQASEDYEAALDEFRSELEWRDEILRKAPYPGQRYRHGWIPVVGLVGDALKLEGRMDLPSGESLESSGHLKLGGATIPMAWTTGPSGRRLRIASVEPGDEKIWTGRNLGATTVLDEAGVERLRDGLTSMSETAERVQAEADRLNERLEDLASQRSEINRRQYAGLTKAQGRQLSRLEERLEYLDGSIKRLDEDREERAGRIAAEVDPEERRFLQGIQNARDANQANYRAERVRLQVQHDELTAGSRTPLTAGDLADLAEVDRQVAAANGELDRFADQTLIEGLVSGEWGDVRWHLGTDEFGQPALSVEFPGDGEGDGPQLEPAELDQLLRMLGVEVARSYIERRDYYDLRDYRGRFRKASDRVGHALNEWLKGNGNADDPLGDEKEFSTASLRSAAKELGVTVPRARRGASEGEKRDLLKLALLKDARARFRGDRDGDGESGPVRMTLQSPKFRDQDVGVYRETNGKVGLYRLSGSSETRGAKIASFADLEGLEAWGRDNGEPKVAQWAASERGAAKPTKRAPAKKAPAKKAPAAPSGPNADDVRAVMMGRHVPGMYLANLDLTMPQWRRLGRDLDIPGAAKWRDEFAAADGIDKHFAGVRAERSRARVEEAHRFLGPTDEWLKQSVDASGGDPQTLRDNATYVESPASGFGSTDRTYFAEQLRRVADHIEATEAAPPAKAAPRKAAKSVPAKATRPKREPLGDPEAKIASLRALGDVEAVRDDLDLHTLPELKTLAKSVGVSGSGRKRDVADRIAEKISAPASTPLSDKDIDTRPPKAGKGAIPDEGSAQDAVPVQWTYAARAITAGGDLIPDADRADTDAAIKDWVYDKEPGPIGPTGERQNNTEPAVNAALRGTAEMTPRRARTVEMLDRALDRSRTTRDATVYRGFTDGSAILPEDWQDRDLTGLTWTNPAFTPTTQSRDGAEVYTGFPEQRGFAMRLRLPAGSPALAVVDEAGGLDDEGEIVLPRGLSYRVVADHGIQGDYGVRWLDVEIVPSSAGSDREQIARDRQSTLDTIRAAAEALVDLDTMANNGGSPRALSHRVDTRVRMGALTEDEGAKLRAALSSGGMSENERRLRAEMGDVDFERRMAGDRAWIKYLDEGVDTMSMDELKALAYRWNVSPKDLRASSHGTGKPLSRTALVAALDRSHRITPKRRPELLVDDADVDGFHAALADILSSRGATTHHTPGDVVPFDGSTMRPQGDRPSPGTPVQVVSPGASMVDSDGTVVTLVPTVVMDASVPDVPRVRPSGLPADRKPESGDFDDLAERVSMLRPKTREAVLEILQDLNASELARLARKYDGPANNAGRRQGMKIPDGLTLDEKRNWLAEKLSAPPRFTWRSADPDSDDDTIERSEDSDTSRSLTPEASEDVARAEDPDEYDRMEDGEDPSLDDIFAMADEDDEDDVERAAGKDVKPGNDRLHHFWTVDPEGRARWVDSPKPWTTLVAQLAKHVGLRKAKIFASRWFIEVFGYAAGSDKNRVAHGRPPRGNRVGPG